MLARVAVLFRLVAAALVVLFLALLMATVALGMLVSPNWFYFTAFVGLNLFQSAFSGWCPMMTFLRKLGVPDTALAGRS